MKRYHIIYKGIVQGVGFRWRLSTIANKYNLTGYARNLDDGDVEVEIQGSGVDEFIKESLNMNSFVEIFDYQLKEIKLVDDDTYFFID